jgi:Spy/CpxP family protein refolding chaperone
MSEDIRLDRRPNPRARALTLLAAAAIVGVVVGVVGDRAYLQYGHPVESRSRSERETDADRIPTPLLQLGLTSDEEQRLRAIARRWRPRAASALNIVRDSVRDLENGMFAEMMCVLTPEQREKYENMLHAGDFAPPLIDRRFALVRANKCPADSGGGRR